MFDRTKLKFDFSLLEKPKPVDLEKCMTIVERQKAELQFVCE